MTKKPLSKRAEDLYVELTSSNAPTLRDHRRESLEDLANSFCRKKSLQIAATKYWVKPFAQDRSLTPAETRAVGNRLAVDFQMAVEDCTTGEPCTLPKTVRAILNHQKCTRVPVPLAGARRRRTKAKQRRK